MAPALSSAPAWTARARRSWLRRWCSERRSGLGTYTFAYARGWAYMTDDPRACANCHVMNEQYDGWIKSSHRSVAVCNDCHVPHSLVGQVLRRKPATASGTRTTSRRGVFPEPIRALPGSRAIAEANCRRCHEPVVAGDGDARTRRIARHLVYPLSRVRGPSGTGRDQRLRSAEVNRVRPETKRNARMEPQCGPDRGARDGRRHRGDRGAPRQHHGAEGGSAEFLLPRRRADRRDRSIPRSGGRTFRCNTTATCAPSISSGRATAAARPCRGPRPRPTRAPSWRNHAWKKIRG